MRNHEHRGNSATQKMISLHHTHNPKANQCTSLAVQRVAAPLPLVWSILRRFDQPQAYKKLVKNCTILGGGGVGSVREVALVSGMPGRMSRERLDRLDEENHVMVYTVIEGDQRLENYQSTTTVHEAEDGGGGAVVIESYVVDVPEGNTEEETRIFADTVLGCHLRYLAHLSEKLASGIIAL
ncbi:abscisic acid receptor PYL12-like [Salvia hispanica]|uniref:abscisic acid receptor PYL12-like n=1 Tax=Salvia hispanica TaxID=49212 RepID=UPI002009B061|nr:abscisic acid receptor PYL12-like [Salvia hispanica]